VLEVFIARYFQTGCGLGDKPRAASSRGRRIWKLGGNPRDDGQLEKDAGSLRFRRVGMRKECEIPSLGRDGVWRREVMTRFPRRRRREDWVSLQSLASSTLLLSGSQQ